MKNFYTAICIFILMQLSASAQNITVTATAGPLLTSSYPTLKAAFDGINNGSHQGIINIRIVNNTAENANCLLDSSGNATSSNYTSILIRPADTATVIKTISMSLTDTTLLTLQGADNLSVDGRPLGLGANIFLTLSNNVNGALSNTVVLKDGASSNQFRFCNITNVANSTLTPVTVRILTGRNSNNIFSRSVISGGYIGLLLNGDDAAPNDNISLLYSQIINQKASAIRLGSGVGNVTLDSNRIFNTIASSTSVFQALFINNINPAATVNFTRNRVFNLNMSASNILQGVVFLPSTASGTLIAKNNSIQLGSTTYPNPSSTIVRAFYFGSNTPATVIAESNTFRIGGTHTTDNGQPTSVCILKSNSSAGSSYTCINNLGINTRTGASNQHVGSFISTPTTGTNTVDYNTYYGGPAQTVAFMSSLYSDLTLYKTDAAPLEQHSSFGLLDFVDDINPDLLTPSSNNTAALLTGTPTTVTTDIYGTIRSLTAPYRGAYEGAPLAPLPVHLVSFVAEIKNNNVGLTWKTHSEINNRGFDIERSVDGSVFNKVAYVTANHSGTITNTYIYTDTDAFTKASSAILFYRLKQLDNNGSFKYSNVEVVNSSKNQLKHISIYPNPVLSTLQVTINSKVTGNASLQIIDASGKTLTSAARSLVAGTNNLLLTETAHLQTGAYFLKITVGEKTTVMRLLKIN
ncbi:MAG: T9SS type A sorting domain-containing protein [Ferruginibacter sp.]